MTFLVAYIRFALTRIAYTLRGFPLAAVLQLAYYALRVTWYRAAFGAVSGARSLGTLSLSCNAVRVTALPSQHVTTD